MLFVFIVGTRRKKTQDNRFLVSYVEIMNKDFFTDKKVLIMGLGRFGGGVDCAEFAARAGAKVIVTDLAPAAQLSDSIEKLE